MSYWFRKDLLHKGGQGSGNFNHKGRPGEVGGSSSDGGDGGGSTKVKDDPRWNPPIKPGYGSSFLDTHQGRAAPPGGRLRGDGQGEGHAPNTHTEVDWERPPAITMDEYKPGSTGHYTRQHYESVVGALRDLSAGGSAELANTANWFGGLMARRFARDNPDFNEAKFQEALKPNTSYKDRSRPSKGPKFARGAYEDVAETLRAARVTGNSYGKFAAPEDMSSIENAFVQLFGKDNPGFKADKFRARANKGV